MKAKDLLTTDIGKWVVIRFEIIDVDEDEDEAAPLQARPHGTSFLNHIHQNTTLEFTNPPEPVQEVGDVFKNLGGYHPAEWTISMIDGDACIMRYLTGHISADYPLNPDLWEFVRKGTQA